MSKNKFRCDVCGDYFSETEITLVETQPHGMAFCPDCLKQHTHECLNCGKPVMQPDEFCSEQCTSEYYFHDEMLRDAMLALCER